MKRVAAILLLASLMGSNLSLARQRPKLLLQARPNARAGAQKRAPAAPWLDVIQGFYLSRLKLQTDITDDQYGKVSLLMKEFLRERSELGGPRRLRAETQLVLAVRRNAPEEELTRLMQEFDRIDEDVAAAKERFFSGADPVLNIRQRARLRVFMINTERQINQYIKLSQSPDAPPVPPPSAPRP